MCRTNTLESLVIAGFVRGLSVRDVEATLAEALGSEATLLKSTISRVCEAIKEEFDIWKRRRPVRHRRGVPLLGREPVPLPAGAEAEPVLAAWGMTTEGRPVLVGLESGASESTDAWSGVVDGMGAGLRPPLLVISHGPPGRIAAVELVFPHSLRQRCVIHRARINPRQGARRAPGRGQEGVLGAVRRHREGTRRRRHCRGPGPGRALRRHLRQAVPSAVDCLMGDFASLTIYLRFPTGHHARIRHSNFIERTFGETRRRVK